MSKTFTVIEYSSFFAVRHNPSGDEHPMGDGVDTLFDEDGMALMPGTPGFIETWEEVLDGSRGRNAAGLLPAGRRHALSQSSQRLLPVLWTGHRPRRSEPIIANGER